MGHSYGGITALGASAKCKLANAVIALDPWFFPHLQDDDIATADHQKSLIVMTEHFDSDIKADKNSNNMDTYS